jgi:hypothetical protein
MLVTKEIKVGRVTSASKVHKDSRVMQETTALKVTRDGKELEYRAHRVGKV